MRRKERFEKMYLDALPPLNLGFTNNGDIFGGTQISFSDVLGDQYFSALIYSIAQYRTIGGSYTNLSGRFQYSIQGAQSEQFFYGYGPGALFGSSYSYLSRDQAIATRRTEGGSISGIYPFDRYRRVELSGGLFKYRETFSNEALQTQSDMFQMQQWNLMRAITSELLKMACSPFVVVGSKVLASSLTLHFLVACPK